MPNLRFAAPKEKRVALITGGARGIGRASALRIAEEGRDTGGRGHLGHLRGEILGGEPRVVAHDQATGGHPALLKIGGHAPGTGTDVVGGEVPPDNGPPSVGAEADP